MSAAAQLGWRLRGALALAASIGASAACTPQPNSPTAQAAAPDAVEALASRCVQDMIRQTCRVMGTAGAPSDGTQGQLFVAGVGAIDAALYRELRDQGDTMCSVVRRHCVQAWHGAPCRTARALYGGP